MCVFAPLTACGVDGGPVVEGLPGEPLPGISEEESVRFQAGKALFSRPFTPLDGLGPLFNQTQCSSCHDLPTSGGHGAEPVRKATRYEDVRGCDLLISQGGDLLQAYVTADARALGVLPDLIPDEATGFSEIQAPALYGLGLVEAIPLATISARADPEDRDGDGLSGRVGGLFGRKASHPSLRSFVEGAAHGELGLTTPSYPTEELPQSGVLPAGADPAADPEVDEAFLGALVDYLRFLAPPPSFNQSDAAARSSAVRGEQIFEQTGCADCHVPTWTTGPNPSEALNSKRFRAYSDFLLHDMGPDLADICAPGVAPSEWRTALLVGLGLRRIFLHNGRAQRLEDAIELHGGEATRSRALFQALGPGSREDLLRFLQSL